MTKSMIILGGGTFYHVRNHLSIAAPAFGTTARWLHQQFPNSELVLTRMADQYSRIETNEDVEAAIKSYLGNFAVKCMVMNVAMCDYDGQIGEVASGKHAQRLKSREGVQEMKMVPSKKVIASIKKQRPDMFLVGFKTTTNHSPQEQLEASMKMVKSSACDLVFANDTTTRHNMLVHASGTCSSASTNRNLVLEDLVNVLQQQQF